MPGLNAISEKLEKFITERDSFRNAVSEAFQKADVDGNRVIAPKEVAAISETMFDLVEKELNDYGIAFQRPTPEQVKTFLEIADRNNDYVLNEEEFFEFYRQVVKYCAVVGSRGFLQKYGPSMLTGLVVACGVKYVLPKIPRVGSSVSPFVSVIPALIVGPLVGFLVAFKTKDYDSAKLKKKLFEEDRNKASTSSV